MLNELLGVDPNIPIFHLVPLIVFGPIFALVLYNFGLKHILNPSDEVKEQIRLRKEEETRQKAEHQQKMDDAGMMMKSAKRTPFQLLGQGATFAVFAVVIGYLSNSPAYIAHPPSQAQLKLSFTHAGKHVEECKKRTREELMALPANMRTPMDCSRERWPVIVDLSLDGEKLYTGVATPTGLSKDGHSSFYEEFSVQSGKHTVTIGMWDSRGDAGAGDYDYELEQVVDLTPKEVLVIGFNNETGQVTLK